jgi:hypothetical protein
MLILPKTSEKTVQAQLSASYFDLLNDLQSLVFDKSACNRRLDITSQIPNWIIYEKEQQIADGYDGITVFDFVQKYYDWLYCDTENGANYELSKNFLDIVDVDKTRSKFLERLANTYAHGFDISSLESNGGLISEDKLRLFINGIRRSFYHKKTTEDGIRYFFSVLFGIDEEDVSIEIPKKFILRLNGGRFYDDNFTFPGGTGVYENIGTLSGSGLNYSRLQDSNWIQDWSYLLKTGIVANAYRQSYLEMAHPAGLKVVFEKTLADYRGPTYDETIPFVCEYPLLKNYAPYGISFDYSGRTAGLYINTTWDPAPSGITLVGLTYNIGCCGIVYTGGFSASTHLFPNWTEQTNVFNFMNININTMLEMCYDSTISSPNSGSSCDITIT